MDTIGAIFRFLGEALGIVRKRQELNNSPEMQAAKAAQNEVKKEDEINKAVANDDADAIRRLGAE